jgi:hypothetical protein
MVFSNTTIDSPPLVVEGGRKRMRLTDAEIDKHNLNCKAGIDHLLPPLRKRVRYATTMTGSVVTRQLPPCDQYSDLDKSALWWTKEERRVVHENSRQLASDFRIHHDDQVQHCRRVFDQCTTLTLTPSKSSSDFLENVTILLPARVRGLECGVVPESKAYRRTHIHQVLDVQDQIREGHLSSDMATIVLGARATRSSRPSRIFARLLAEGDEDSLVGYGRTKK